MKLDIVITGVGGQGTLLASKILGALAAEKNETIKVSEVHGMSQRGGNVVTYVRIGEDIHSPLVDLGTADYVLAFERLEALRALPYLKQGGTIITSTQMIAPMPVVTGNAEYPQDVMDQLRENARVVAIDALALAQKAGEPRAVNLVLLGVLCALEGESRDLWEKAIAACVPEKILKANLEAFRMGAKAEG